MKQINLNKLRPSFFTPACCRPLGGGYLFHQMRINGSRSLLVPFRVPQKKQCGVPLLCPPPLKMPKTRPAGEIVIVVFGESEALDLLTTALGGSVEEKLKVVLGRRRCIIFSHCSF